MDLISYINTLTELQKTYFNRLHTIIKEVYPEVMFMIFVKQAYFYLKEHETIKPHHRPSIMIAIFKDHMNIFTTINKDYINELSMYKFTDKHTLQIYFKDDIIENKLKKLFKDALKS